MPSVDTQSDPGRDQVRTTDGLGYRTSHGRLVRNVAGPGCAPDDKLQLVNVH